MPTVTFTREATLEWQGDLLQGTGTVSAASTAFDVRATYPHVRGDPPGVTTPEELLAASHAVCFGIGVRSVIARQRGSAASIRTTATITAEKGPDGIRIRRSHLRAIVVGLDGISPEQLAEIGALVERECTISAAIHTNVRITHEVITE
jgi:lipoyl-dependent peroxiredoxin